MPKVQAIVVQTFGWFRRITLTLLPLRWMLPQVQQQRSQLRPSVAGHHWFRLCGLGTPALEATMRRWRRRPDLVLRREGNGQLVCPRP